MTIPIRDYGDIGKLVDDELQQMGYVPLTEDEKEAFATIRDATIALMNAGMVIIPIAPPQKEEE